MLCAVRRLCLIILLVSLPANDLAAAAHWHQGSGGPGAGALHIDDGCGQPHSDPCSQCQFLAAFAVTPALVACVRYEPLTHDAVTLHALGIPDAPRHRPEKPPRA
jgi:hypothetical protein